VAFRNSQLEGDAARAIAGLPLTESNYAHSITLLADQFGQPHNLVNAHMQALLSMPPPSNSLAGLHIFYDSGKPHSRIIVTR